MKKIFSLIITGILAFFLFVLANISVAWISSRTIIDFTSNKQYTLSKDAVQSVNNLPEPITFRFYVSENLANYDWNMGGFAAKIASTLNSYYLAAPDKIKLEIRKISPSSDMEQQAIQDGILPLTADDRDYFFGLQVRNKNKIITVPSFNPDRKQTLENDIERIINAFNTPKKTVVGVMSSKLPLWAENEKNPSSALMSMLKEYYSLVKVMPTDGIIAQDIDVLVVVYPVEFSSVFGYALDQYVMRGGKVIFVVDPYSELQHQIQGYPPRSDEKIGEYLQKWGIGYGDNLVVGNFSTAEKIKAKDGKSYLYPLWFFVRSKDGKNLHFRTAGEIFPTDRDKFDYDDLVSTGDQGGKIKVSDIRYASKPQIIKAYEQDGRDRITVMRVKGKFYSHYYENILAGTDSEKNVQPYIPFSISDNQIVVIADSDFVSDESWVASYNENNPVYGAVSYADNASFLVEQIDYLSGKRLPQSISSELSRATNIAEVIYNESFFRHHAEREQAETEESQSAAYLNNLQRRKLESEDVAFRKILNAAEKQNMKDKKRLQNINRNIEAEANKMMTYLLVLNLIVIPLLVLVLIFIVIGYKRYLFQKHVKAGR